MVAKKPKKWRPQKVMMSQGSLSLKRKSVPTRKQLVKKISNFVKKQRKQGPRHWESA